MFNEPDEPLSLPGKNAAGTGRPGRASAVVWVAGSLFPQTPRGGTCTSGT